MRGQFAAVGVDPDHPKITEEQAQWAIDVTTWSNENWVERIRLTGGETHQDKEWHRVEKIIERPGDHLHLANQAKQHKQLTLLKQGYVPWSVLLRGTKLPKRRLTEILSDMHEAELIASADKDGNACYFSKRHME